MSTWQFLADNLPHATATLNVVATVLLVLALRAIRRGQARVHKRWMLTAVGVSALFLLLYLLHKLALFQTTGQWNKRFPTDPSVAPDAFRYSYYGVLGTHLLLALTVPVLVLRAVFLAIKGRIIAHKRWVKFAYPIWMYVSVTGVLVYLMLYHHQRLFGSA
jgi:putative membrane protein